MRIAGWAVLGLATVWLLDLVPYAGLYTMAALLVFVWLGPGGPVRDWTVGGLAALTLDAWLLERGADGSGWPMALAEPGAGWRGGLAGGLLLAGAGGLIVARLRATGRPRSARALVLVSVTTTAVFFLAVGPLWTVMTEDVISYYPRLSPLHVLIAALPLALVVPAIVLAAGCALAAGGWARWSGYALIPVAGLALLAQSDVLAGLRAARFDPTDAFLQPSAAPMLAESTVSIQVLTTGPPPAPADTFSLLAVGICLLGLAAAGTATPQPEV